MALISQKRHPAKSSRTFRIFVSSTFSDLKAERNAWQQKGFPRLRELCAGHGCNFQAIDLRWEASEEGALDQRTLNICLAELERCRRVTPRPNFIVVLGDHYGWRLLPAQVNAAEAEARVELQAIHVGPVVFLANPGKLFCQYGLGSKAVCRFPFTFSVELANGCNGYSPTEEAFDANGGGYETRLTSYGHFGPVASRMIVNGLLELASGLVPGGWRPWPNRRLDFVGRG